MNPKLQFKYEEMDIPGWKGIRCVIGIEGCSFTSLGLDKGQTKLNEKQVKWFETNGDQVIKACEDVKVAPTGPPYPNPEYSRLVKIKHHLLDRFCKECDIVDS